MTERPHFGGVADVPATIQDVLAARIARLDDADRAAAHPGEL